LVSAAITVSLSDRVTTLPNDLRTASSESRNSSCLSNIQSIGSNDENVDADLIIRHTPYFQKQNRVPVASVHASSSSIHSTASSIIQGMHENFAATTSSGLQNSKAGARNKNEWGKSTTSATAGHSAFFQPSNSASVSEGMANKRKQMHVDVELLDEEFESLKKRK
jgi:CCR4-NOT transcriptional regulation complex NOT5 subunit